MKGGATRSMPFRAVILSLLFLGSALAGQTDQPSSQAVGLPTDWTHYHLIFSQPSTDEQARSVAADPRYWQQLQRETQRRGIVANSDEAALADLSGLQSMWRTTVRLKGDWSEDLGSGGSVGAGNFPAKFSFQLSTANCGNTTTPDFVAFSTGLAGSATQASIVAYDNLYSGCTGTVPSVFWAYDTGGQIKTSPVLALDGSQLAFVDTNAGAARLVVLKWAASAGETFNSPGALTTVTPAFYRACAAPCMTAIALLNGSNTATDDTTSSVFYDYGLDSAWVGDSQGWLHQFTGIFGGTPSEIRTSPWPVHASPTTLTSPVHDRVGGNVFLSDVGGFVYRVSTNTGAVTKSAQLDHGAGFVVGPVVDLTAGKVYAFASNDGTTGTTNCAGSPGPCSAVYQLPTTLSSSSKITVGSGSTTIPMFIGTFDSTYRNSANATGNIYVCGDTGGNPILYQIPIAAGVMSAASVGPVLGSQTAGCSPVSDVVNPNVAVGGTEWLFASVQNNGGLVPGCGAGGCVFNFKDTPWKASTAYSVGQEVLDGHFRIHVVSVPGTSGTTTPAWSAANGGSTTDGGVTWLTQGRLNATTPTWQANAVEPVGFEILDSKNNIEVVTRGGTSGGTQPVWKTTVGATTVDNSIHWRNVGAVATFSQAAAGGTGGIIIDNTVPATTLAGASQIYYATRSDQVCTTSGGTGRCAVQASQPALQ
jgi:hypothetical protein